MANSGFFDDARVLARRMLDVFAPYEYVVCPSGSCTSMVRNQYESLLPRDSRVSALRAKTRELCEFLHDVLGVRPRGRFPHKVGLHQSCHGLRELRLGSGSERLVTAFSKIGDLLAGIEGLELTQLARSDECCGFRRHLLGGGGGGLLRDGARPDRGSRARRLRGDHRRGLQLPDAPRRPASGATARSFASCTWRSSWRKPPDDGFTPSAQLPSSPTTRACTGTTRRCGSCGTSGTSPAASSPNGRSSGAWHRRSRRTPSRASRTISSSSSATLSPPAPGCTGRAMRTSTTASSTASSANAG